MGSAFHQRVEVWCDALHLSLSHGPLGRVPRDHVAVLSGLLAHAWLAGSAGDVLAEAIVTEALAPWVPRFIDAVLLKSTNPLYRATVQLLQVLLDEDTNGALGGD